MVLAKNCDHFHLNSFPHMDVVTFDFFNYVIKLRIFWNSTQHWNISRIEELCLPTKLVHILYVFFAYSLINHSLKIYIKLINIRIKESAHIITSGFFSIEGSLNFFFIGICHRFVPLSDFFGEIINSLLHVCTIKLLKIRHWHYFLE